MKPKGPGSKNLNMMNRIATDMVVQRAVDDKMTQATDQMKKDSQRKAKAKRKTFAYESEESEEFDSDCSMDSAEEEIMRRMKDRMGTDRDERRKEDEKMKKDTGVLKEIHEKEFFDLIKNKKERIVATFYHEDFNRCKILNSHMEKLAHLHPESLFVKINVQKSPFMVQKLKLKTLPTMIYFQNGNARDRVIGFEDFGNRDDFKTQVVATRLARYGAIVLNEDEKFKLVTKTKKRRVGGESDSEDED